MGCLMAEKVDLRVNVLGRPWISMQGAELRLSPSAAHTMAFLALGPDEGPSRAQMATHLFADCLESVARRRLSTALWRLRAEFRDAVGHEVVDTTSSHRVCLLPDIELQVDAKEFRRSVRAGLSHPAEGMSADDAVTLEQAEASYVGCLMESAYDDWVIAERDNLGNLYLAVLDQLVQYHGVHRNANKVAEYADKAVDLEPLREDLHQHVMIAYSLAGRNDLADRQFHLCRLALLRELGADPMPETLALHSRLKAGIPRQSHDLSSLVSDLERARRDVQDLAALVERALEAVLELR